jgi:hypothetical protein
MVGANKWIVVGRAGLAFWAAAMLLGCTATAGPAPIAAHSLSADLILTGRFVASEEIAVHHPISKVELSHVADSMRLLTFETAHDPKLGVKFIGPPPKCPPEDLSRQVYIVALRKVGPIKSLEHRSRGKLISPRSQVISDLEMVACAPLEASSSYRFPE